MKDFKHSLDNNLINMIHTLKSRDGKLTPTKSELTQQYSLEIGLRPISSQVLTSMDATSLL